MKRKNYLQNILLYSTIYFFSSMLYPMRGHALATELSDAMGLETEQWKGLNDENEVPNGYQWDPANAWSVDRNGNKTLKESYYHQAIFFSENGTFDARSSYNMGTSTATVFKADGTTQSFLATSYPSDLHRYPTIREGRYEATVGLHWGIYTALRMHDIGSCDGRIELGFKNPAFKDGRTWASSINIHKPRCLNNLTGMTPYGTPSSAGCMLIDRDKWKLFIGHFDTDAQRTHAVGITISRTYTQPVIVRGSVVRDYFSTCAFICRPDATRVYTPNVTAIKRQDITLAASHTPLPGGAYLTGVKRSDLIVKREIP